jgi:DNA-3-methyladenine glycosylase
MIYPSSERSEPRSGSRRAAGEAACSNNKCTSPKIRKRLKRKFFSRDTLKVCREILGKHIVRVYRNKKIVGKIVEVEAYIGPEDKASHAFGGKITKRNRAEYLVGGHIYIYLVYGMYWQLNISTGLAGRPECVLIRALEPILGDKNPKSEIRNPKQISKSKFSKPASGPGKLCQWLKLNKSFYGEDITKSGRLWFEDFGERLPKNKIAASPRIGIDYAGPVWAQKPWRFYLKNNKYVSKQN